ncbi:MAG: hypothetical protein JSV44_06105, partial [Candidatus Zixiibacteriota bacterium]
MIDYYPLIMNSRRKTIKRLLPVIVVLFASVASLADPGDSIDMAEHRGRQEAIDTAASAVAGESASGFNTVYPMSAERRDQLITYTRFKNIWRFFSFFLDAIILLALLY